MSDDDVRDLLGAYALDAVTDDERAAVEELVRRDPDAATELADLRAAAADLGAALATAPPADLRGRVLAEAAATPQDDSVLGRPAPAGTPTAPAETSTAETSTVAPARADEAPNADVVPLAPRRRARTRWVAIAAAVVIGAAIPAGVAVQQHRELEAMRADQAHLEAMLSDPAATMLHADVAGGGTASAVVADGSAMFMTQGLPDPEPGHVYQLWVVGPSGDPVSAGMLAGGGAQTAMVPDGVSADAALAMTLEPAGGSPQPTTDPLVVLAS